MSIHRALGALKYYGPQDRGAGVCCVMRGYDQRAWMRRAFLDWPEYSGYMAFPVPHPRFPSDPAEGYRRTRDKWVGDYGDARMRLLDFLIARAEEQGV